MSLFFRKTEERDMQHWFGTGADGPENDAVTADNAPRLSPVFAAHRHIVDYISTLPVDAYRKSSEAVRQPVALPRLFANLDEPGAGGIVTWLGQAAYGLANGNAVGFITQADGFGFPTRVSWLHWSQWGFDEGTKQWTVLGSLVPSSQLLHIPWIVPPGKTLGLSPIEYYASTVRAGRSAQEYANVKRGGGLPPVVLKNNARTLDVDVAEVVKARAKSSFAKGEPFVTGSDWDLTAFTIPPNHAQFIETLKLSANQIAAIYGIDPTEIGGEAANSLTYSTEELRQINRAANLQPYIVRLERAFARVMPSKQFIRLNVESKMRVDTKTRTGVVGEQIRDGRLSVNEARTLEDRPPVPGGDFHNVPAPGATPSTQREGETS